jgi:F0F1-type ATP synthase assembly protein I
VSERGRDPGGRSAVGLRDLLSIGAVCGVMIGLGVFLGYLLDRAAGTAPLLTFVGLAFGILGAATGSYFVIRPFLSASHPVESAGSETKD